jgi:hypothetical protein
LGPQNDHLSGSLTSCPEDIDFNHRNHQSALKAYQEAELGLCRRRK